SSTAVGSIVFGGGTLQYSAANNADYSGRFSTAASQPIVIDTNAQTVTFATALSSSNGTLTVNDSAGTGTLILTAANAYSGATTITAGALQLGANGATGSLATASSIADNGTLIFNRSNAVTQGTDFTASAITGGGSLTQIGSGVLTLNAVNLY